MSKRVYICGDSFAVSDPEYGPCWVDLMAKEFSIRNLSQVCASNLLISKQVDQAIAEAADFIICLGTSSTRQNVRHGSEVVPYSIYSINWTTKFSVSQQDILKRHVTEFFDLNTAIYESKCIIENTLQKLVDSGIPFLFDQGGFEHPKFAGTANDYFTKYKDHFSKINLWSYTDTRPYRPYYHITDANSHKEIADYYINVITQTQ